jgi:hypothetical protein
MNKLSLKKVAAFSAATFASLSCPVGARVNDMTAGVDF